MIEDVLCFECSLAILDRGGSGGREGTRVLDVDPWDVDVDAELDVETEGLTGMGAGGEMGGNEFDVDASLSTIFECERDPEDFGDFANAKYSSYVVGNLVVKMPIHRFRSSLMKYFVLNRRIPLMKVRIVSRSAVGGRLPKCEGWYMAFSRSTKSSTSSCRCTT